MMSCMAELPRWCFEQIEKRTRRGGRRDPRFGHVMHGLRQRFAHSWVMPKIRMQTRMHDVPHPRERLLLAACIELARRAAFGMEFFDVRPERIDTLPLERAELHHPRDPMARIGMRAEHAQRTRDVGLRA